MKKFLFVLIVLLLISVTLPVISSAEGFDLSSMSLEELLELRNAVDEEIRARVSQPSDALYNGRYVVGVDIKPGRYLLEIHSLPEGVELPEIIVKTGEKKEDYGMFPGMSAVIDLSDGMIMQVDGVLSATLTDVPQASYAP